MEFMISHFCDEENSRTAIFSANRSIETPALLGADDSIDDENRLPPEMEMGNIEYKVKLVKPSVSRLQHLITQMKWRLSEGQGEALYELGVEDGGALSGLTDDEMTETLNTLRAMADALDATVIILTERDVTLRGAAVRRTACEVLVRRIPERQLFGELRLAILGGPDSGKSTLCGVLTQGTLDDGQGKTRLNLFRYLHEVQTGKTSSICLDVIGFNDRRRIVNYRGRSLEEMVAASSKLVTLIDLAGDRKYLKTTTRGLCGYDAHIAGLVVSAETGPTAITREHLGLVLALGIRPFVLVTKTDLVDKKQLDVVISSVQLLLLRAGFNHGVRRVKTRRDAAKAASDLSRKGAPVPLFAVSCVTGEKLRLLRIFLGELPAVVGHGNGEKTKRSGETVLPIDEIFSVPHVGTVVCGVLAEGGLVEGQTVKVGPSKTGHFVTARVESLRRSRQPVKAVGTGESVSVAISGVGDLPLRRGMALFGSTTRTLCSRRFIARLFVLCHNTDEVCRGFQATVYIGAVCQRASVAEILDGASMRVNTWSTVQLEFYSQPEFLRAGTPVILLQGKTKATGEVMEVEELRV